jgi:hypothetical protein
MKPGDVVRMTSFHDIPMKGVKISYKTEKKGERAVFMLLGNETDEEPLDPVKALEAMGWVGF